MPYSILVRHPDTTLAGATAQSAKYTITSVHGNSARTISAPEFCREQKLSLAALLRHVRYWPDGWHTDKFQTLVDAMRARVRGNYVAQGRKLTCPHCGTQFHKNLAMYKARRDARDASPLGSAIRARPASYFGETPRIAAYMAASAPGMFAGDEAAAEAVESPPAVTEAVNAP